LPRPKRHLDDRRAQAREPVFKRNLLSFASLPFGSMPETSAGKRLPASKYTGFYRRRRETRQASLGKAAPFGHAHGF